MLLLYIFYSASAYFSNLCRIASYPSRYFNLSVSVDMILALNFLQLCAEAAEPKGRQKKARHTNEQNIPMIKEMETGAKTADVDLAPDPGCRGVSDPPKPRIDYKTPI